DVAVVGGGASAILFVAQLLRRVDGPLRVAIVDRAGAFAQGVAYSTKNPRHVLNVPAVRMAPFPDRPNDFFEWARARWPQTKAGSFLPRASFAEYLSELLQRTQDAGPPGSRVHLVADEVKSIVRIPEGFRLLIQMGPPIQAYATVLAWGQGPPAPPM